MAGRHHAVLMASAVLPLAATFAFAGPNGANVVGGAATVQGQGTGNVIVNQTSQNAIINWQTFNIGASETTKIYMPNSASTELDRVTGGQGPSQILGTLNSNGKVFLVNPDGILFGMGARINVGSLVATTNDIANRDFMAGRYSFTIPGNPNASVVNMGTITAQSGGFAALVAPGVRNTGTITARLGTIALASGNAFTLDMYGDNLITLGLGDSIASQVIDVATGKPLKSLVSNKGKLKANGGTVVLTAVAARKIVDSVINNSGVIEANTIGSHKGMIVLEGPTGVPNQKVRVAGRLSVAGKRKGTSGGTIQITGQNIQVAGATINASGQAGGGTVLIGGDWGGGHPNSSLAAGNASAVLQPYALPNADNVSIDAATMIDASAIGIGNGGKVIVWANQATTFLGTILAKGGAQSGNGGFVETSGGKLIFNGAVNTSAPAGKAGMWLLDPTDLTIDAAAASTINTNLATTNVTLETTEGGASGPGNQSNGPGDIIVASPISWSSANTLTLSAYNAITINAPINVAGAGGLILDAANNGLAPAAPLISFGNGASVQFTGAPNSGQSLTINNQAYTLLYSMSDVQSINANSNTLKGSYALALPLDASSTMNWTPIGTDAEGNVLRNGQGFSGAFQGLGNTISELTINLPNSSYVGLFGYSNGVVENLGLVDGNVSGHGNVGALIGFNDGSVVNAYATTAIGVSVTNASSKFAINAGGLVGANGNAGSITNSYANGPISISFASASDRDEIGTINSGGMVGSNSGSISNSYASGAVNVSITGTGEVPIDVDASVGGLVGSNRGSISTSSAGGTVSITGTNLRNDIIAGGLVGSNDSSIQYSYATGSVSIGLTNAGTSDDSGASAGGLVGYNTGSVGYTYATGPVSINSNIAGSVGGLVGSSFGTISQSYFDITTSGIGSQNGVGNVANASGVTGLTTVQFGNTTNFVDWNFGTTAGGSGWVIVDNDGSLNNAGGALGATRPMLLSEWSSTISNPHQLQLMALDLSANYTLANNIDLGSALLNAADVWGPNGGAGFVPIGGNSAALFTGSLNGNGNTISNLTINTTSLSYVGLFGEIGSAGTVQNLGLVGGSVSGGFETGALAGSNGGTLSNVYETGAVTAGDGSIVGGLVGSNVAGSMITQSYATGPVMAGNASSAGGLVGENFSTISQSYATGVVTGGDISLAGGLIGVNFSTVSQSHATGAVTVGEYGSAGGLVGATGLLTVDGDTPENSIASSYATGAVTTGEFGTAGGLVGYNFNGIITQSYASGAVTIGANSIAGGFVGENFTGATITNSYSTGAASSTDINVVLGGFVGENDPGAIIVTSQAYGAVTSTASLMPSNNNNNCLTVSCEYANVGGFVGANYGAISGAAFTSAPANCASSFTCASGNVAVGRLGSGGGFAGYNAGNIQYAFATGNVVGAAGLADTGNGNVFDNTTQIGGFVADNHGQIVHAFATGSVGTAGTMWLSAAGFAATNEGTIDSSFAAGAVVTGDNSTAGGFVQSNTPDNNVASCSGCFTGDGFNNSAAISNSQAFGDVTVGALSIAGGFATISGNNHSQTDGNLTNVSASGAVNAGHDSIIGGLVGVLGESGTIANSTARNKNVASSGANSIIGGIAGVNEGTISDTSSTAPVSGTSDSYIGGITGINIGLVTGSSTEPAISGSGGDNFIGGIAGLNVGLLTSSTGQVALTSGLPNYTGGVAGVNAAYTGTQTTIANSSFPIGTITNSSSSGIGFIGQVGTSAPSFIPGLPSWLARCTDAACTTLTGGSVQLGTSPGNPNTGPPSENLNTGTTPENPDTSTAPTTPTVAPTVPTNTVFSNQQVLQFTQPANFTTTNIAPPLVDPTVLASLNGGLAANGTGGGINGNNSYGNGNNGSLANGRQGGNGAPPGMRLIDMRVMPLPPGSGLPPPGETRFVSNQIVLQFGANLTPQQIAAIAQRFGLTIVTQQSIGSLGRTVYTFRINNGQSVTQVIRAIDNAGLQAAAQPNYSYGLTQDQPSSAGGNGDPAQYIVQKLQLGAVHRITEGKDVIVALIDSQVDIKQPDIAGRIIDNYDAGCGPNTPPDAHGTGMAGAIAAHIGLLGVAPNAKIIAICAFGGSGTPEATSAKIIRGMDYAIAHNAKIINMSFAGPRDPALAQELQIAREKGILIIAAAGNAGPKSPPLYPGADPNVMAVTATDEHDRLFTGANQGSYVTVAAPGVNILVPAPNGDVQFTTGTSVASANVSGVAALLMAEKEARTPAEIRSILVDTAKHLGPKGMNPQFGAGLVDPLKALRVPAPPGRSSTAAPRLQLH